MNLFNLERVKKHLSLSTSSTVKGNMSICLMCFSKLERLLVMMNKEGMQTEYLAFIIQVMSKTKERKTQRKRANRSQKQQIQWWYSDRGLYSQKQNFYNFSTTIQCRLNTIPQRLLSVWWKTESDWQTFQNSRWPYLTISVLFHSISV